MKIAASAVTMSQAMHDAELDGEAILEGDASAIVGDEASVATQLRDLLDAGATDIWAAIFPVGDDGGASRRRTRALLQELAAAG